MLREIRGGVLGISGEGTIGRRGKGKVSCPVKRVKEGGKKACAFGYLHLVGTDDPWIDVQDPARTKEQVHNCKRQRGGRKTGMMKGTGPCPAQLGRELIILWHTIRKTNGGCGRRALIGREIIEDVIGIP